MRQSRAHRPSTTSTRWSPPALAARSVLAALAALCLLLAGLPGARQEPVEAAEAGTRRVIIEFHGAAALDGRGAGTAGTASSSAQGATGLAAARATLQRQRAGVLAEAKRRRLDIRPGRAFGLLVNGLAAEVDAADVERLRALPGVAAVHPDRRFGTLLDVSVPLVGAPELWEGDGEQRPPVTGEGQVVAVIDTGVDYTHPALGGGFGPGHKVVGGYDYVNDDGDPMDDHGHGTHVAGIVAAEGVVTGVAPGASVTAYKVLNAGGFGFESDIIAAIEDAADPANPQRADVINMSLGADSGDEPGPLDEAARVAAESGVVVVAAAGNSGPWDYSVSSPAVAPGVVAVGASISGVRVPRVDIVEPDFAPIDARRVSYSANAPDEPILAEVVDVGMGMPWDYDDLDVTGKAVVVHGPAEDSIFAALTAMEQGAVAALFSWRSNTPVAPGAAGAAAPPGEGLEAGHDFPHAGKGLAQGPSGEPGVQVDDGRLDDLVVVEISASGFGAIERRRAEGTVVLRIGGQDATDEMARFSSRGPTLRHALKPELSAPGVSILSTVPQSLHAPGTYRFSGTSMAAPHVAGAAALLGQARPELSGQQVSAALIGSALPVDGWNPLVQGAGRLDVPRAATTSLLATPPTLSLGVTGGQAGGSPLEFTSDVTLSNPGAQPVTVSFRHEARSGSASAEVQPASVTLEPGAGADVTVTVTAEPTGGDIDHTGWVVAETAGEPVLHVPYAAFERALLLHVTDPAFDTVEVFVFSPVVSAAPPAITITGPGGYEKVIEATHDHGRWWRATLPVGDPGTYRATASLHVDPAEGHGSLHGEAAFEVLAAHQRLRGASSWLPVGPDSGGGRPTPTGHRGMVVATEGPSTLFVTDDKGRTWRQHTDLPIAGAGTGLVVADPADPDRLYYGVAGHFYDFSYRGRLLTSRDGGLNWDTLPFPDVEIRRVYAAQDGLLVISTDKGLYTSGDRGATWENVPVPFEVWDLDSGRLVGRDLYVATFTGLWVVRGLGGSTVPEAELLWQPPGLSGWVTALAGDEEWLFAAALDNWVGTVYRSADRGRTWEPLVEVEGPVLGLELVGDRVVASGLGPLLWGLQYGTTWTQGDEPVHGGLVMGSATWAPPGDSGKAPGRSGKPGDVLLGVFDAGIYSAGGPADGWERIGVQAVTVSDLASAPGPDGSEQLLAGTRIGLYRTPAPTAGVTPAMRDWGAADGEGGVGRHVALVAPSPHDERVLYRVLVNAISDFTIERSDDHGASWEPLHSERERPTALLVHPEDDQRVYVSFVVVTLSGLLVTTDGGRTWGIHYQDEEITALAADPADPEALLLGTASGLYRSGDGGATRDLVEGGPVTAILTDPRTPDRVVLGGGDLRVSSDGGQTFEGADHARLPLRVSDIVASPTDPDRLLAGTTTYREPTGLLQPGRGVLSSRDGGRSWENVSDTLQNRSVTSLAVTRDGRHLFAGTTAGGVHRLRLR